MLLKNVMGTDLNLLKALHAIGAERHLTRAGARIGLTQPAMSHALRRLRLQFQDELFVRTGDGMVPTARATELLRSVHEVLEQMERALTREHGFDPAKARQTFRIGMNDYGAPSLVPRLIAVIRQQAPGVVIRAVQISVDRSMEPDRFEQVYRSLDTGSIDLAIIPHGSHPSRFEAENLFSDRAVCIVARRNGAVGDRMDLETYLALGHIRMTNAVAEKSWVDDHLETLGRARNVVATVPHSAAALAAVANSDLIATVPESVVRSYGFEQRLKVSALPIPPRIHRFTQVWPRSRSADSAHGWLRATVRRSCVQ